MKKMMLFVLLIVGISFAGLLPFNGTDVAKLHPVEVLVINRIDSNYVIRTDTGLLGAGTNVDAAVIDLKQTAPGEIFLETANYILVGKECSDITSSFYDYLRPACQVYTFEGEGEFGEIAKYLANHPSSATILTYRQGIATATNLVVDKEVCRIVYQ